MLPVILTAAVSDSLGQGLGAHAVVVAYLHALSLFAWPVVVFVLVWTFRDEIGGFIKRALEIRVGGASVSAQAQRPQATGGPVRPGVVPQIVGRGSADPDVQAIVGVLRENLRLDSDQDTEHQVQTLLGTAAQVSLAWAFERLYSNIFGSQLDALQFLNTRPATREIIRSYYDVAAAHNTAFFQNFGFEPWFGFLLGSTLIGEHDGQVTITNLGRIFLQYIVQQGLPLWRPN